MSGASRCGGRNSEPYDTVELCCSWMASSRLPAVFIKFMLWTAASFVGWNRKDGLLIGWRSVAMMFLMMVKNFVPVIDVLLPLRVSSGVLLPMRVSSEGLSPTLGSESWLSVVKLTCCFVGSLARVFCFCFAGKTTLDLPKIVLAC